MPGELIVLIAAILVSWLVFRWLVQVLKASINAAFAIAVIVLGLQLLFGIGPNELLQHIFHLPQTLWQIVKGK